MHLVQEQLVRSVELHSLVIIIGASTNRVVAMSDCFILTSSLASMQKHPSLRLHFGVSHAWKSTSP